MSALFTDESLAKSSMLKIVGLLKKVKVDVFNLLSHYLPTILE